MEENKIDPQTGKTLNVSTQQQGSCSPEIDGLRRRTAGSNAGLGAVVEGGQAARQAGQGWLGRNKYYILGGLLFLYVIAARVLREQQQQL